MKNNQNKLNTLKTLKTKDKNTTTRQKKSNMSSPLDKLLIQYRIPQVVMNKIDEYEEMEIRKNYLEHRRSIYNDVMNQYYENFFCYNCGKTSLWMMRTKLYNCSSICDHQYRDGGGHYGHYGVPRAYPCPFPGDEEDNIYNPNSYNDIFDENSFLNKKNKYIKNATTMSDYISNHKYDLKYVFEEMEVVNFERRQWKYAYDAVMNELK